MPHGGVRITICGQPKRLFNRPKWDSENLNILKKQLKSSSFKHFGTECATIKSKV